MKLVAIAGDGIGPETVSVGVQVMQAAASITGAQISVENETAGHASLDQFGTTIRPELVSKAEQMDGLILGPMTTHDLTDPNKGEINPSAFFRKHFDLYANIRPARTYDGMPRRTEPFDLVVARENTEGFYADRNMVSGSSEIQVTPDVVISMRRITRHCSERIARAAFELAMARRRKLTIVHKANVLKVGDGLFIEACMDVAKQYPEVQIDSVIVDAMMAHVVREPQRFDVIVTTNMFGDILSDLTAELAGSLGMAASLNAGDNFAMAQAAHGSAIDIAGKNVANPLSQVISIAMLLAWYGQRKQSQSHVKAAEIMQAAVAATVEQRQVTRDMGGSLGTDAVGQAVVDNLQKAV